MTKINNDATIGANAHIPAATPQSDPTQNVQQQATIDPLLAADPVVKTAEKTAKTITNQTSSYFAWAQEGVSNFANATATSFSDMYADLSARFSQFSSEAQKALSYEGLSNAGRGAFESCAQVISGTMERVTSSTPVTTANEWISIGAENVASAANKTAQAGVNSYLPLSVLALGALTAGYSAKKAVESFRTNHIGRSVVQVLVGASAAVIAGSIAFGSPVGQSLDASVRGLFAKS